MGSEQLIRKLGYGEQARILRLEELSRPLRIRAIDLAEEAMPGVEIHRVLLGARSWDVRPIVLGEGGEVSLVRLASPDVFLANQAACILKDLIVQLPVYSSLSSSILDYGTINGNLWIRRVFSKNLLSNRRELVGILDLYDRLQICGKILRKLKEWQLHELFHGHLSVENIFINRDGDLCFLDAGLAISLMLAKVEHNMLDTATEYSDVTFAPEVYFGKVDPKCDLFGAGHLLRKLLLDRKGFGEASTKLKQVFNLLDKQILLLMSDHPSHRPDLLQVETLLNNVIEEVELLSKGRPKGLKGHKGDEQDPEEITGSVFEITQFGLEKANEATAEPSSEDLLMDSDSGAEENSENLPLTEEFDKELDKPNLIGAEPAFDKEKHEAGKTIDEFESSNLPSSLTGEVSESQSVAIDSHTFDETASEDSISLEELPSTPPVEIEEESETFEEIETESDAFEENVLFEHDEEDSEEETVITPAKSISDRMEVSSVGGLITEMNPESSEEGENVSQSKKLTIQEELIRKRGFQFALKAGVACLGLFLLWTAGKSFSNYELSSLFGPSPLASVELEGLWFSSNPSDINTVVDAALDEQNSSTLLAIDTIINTSLDSKISESAFPGKYVYRPIIKHSVRKEWEKQLTEANHRELILIASCVLGNCEVPFQPENWHPGIYYGLCAAGEAGKSQLISGTSAEQFLKLPLPFNSGFSELLNDNPKLTLGDKSVWQLVKIESNNGASSKNKNLIYEYLKNNTEVHIKALANISKGNKVLVNNILVTLQSIIEGKNKSMTINSPVISWARKSNILKSSKLWGKNISDQNRLAIVAGVFSDKSVELTAQELHVLAAHPSLEMRRFAINGLYDLSSNSGLAFRGALNVLDYVLQEIEGYSDVLLYQLVNLLKIDSDNSESLKAAYRSFAKASPSHELLEQLLLTNSGQEIGSGIDIPVILSLGGGAAPGSKKWSPSEDTLKKLATHPEPLVRAVSCDRFYKMFRGNEPSKALAFLKLVRSSEKNSLVLNSIKKNISVLEKKIEVN